MSFKPLSISDISQWNIVQPKKRKKHKDSPNSSLEIETANSFEALADQEVSMNSEDSVRMSEPKLRKPKIPPLVIYTHIEDHVKTLKDIQKELKEPLSISCKQNRMIIYPKNEEDYVTLSEKIKAAKVHFHTYSLEKEKPVVSILKGLPPNIKPFEIKEELENSHKLKVSDVKQFVKKAVGDVREFKLPIFSVKFQQGTKISEVKKIKTLCWCKIYWEKSMSSNSVTRCYKCQAFGHIAKNCFRADVCANCAGEHNTANCGFQNLHKCANCGGDHRANDTAVCTAFIRAANRKSHTNNFANNRFLKRDDNRLYSSGAHSFADAVRQRQTNGKSTNGNNNSQDHNNDFTFASLFKEIKDLFRNFNLQKIISAVKNTTLKIQSCDDPVSKFSCIIEGLVEIFE